jgi:hypothetical protein
MSNCFNLSKTSLSIWFRGFGAARLSKGPGVAFGAALGAVLGAAFGAAVATTAVKKMTAEINEIFITFFAAPNMCRDVPSS